MHIFSMVRQAKHTSWGCQFPIIVTLKVNYMLRRPESEIKWFRISDWN